MRVMTSTTYASIVSRPSARATDTRWWPSRTKCTSPTRYTEIGGSGSPRRAAFAMRSQRGRTRGVGGRDWRAEAPGAPPAGRPRVGAGALVFQAAVRAAVDRPEDRVELDRLQADVALLDAAERVDDLAERQDDVDVARVAAEPPRELRHHLAAPGALEVVLGVCPREAGIAPHRIEGTRRIGARPPARGRDPGHRGCPWWTTNATRRRGALSPGPDEAARGRSRARQGAQYARPVTSPVKENTIAMESGSTVTDAAAVDLAGDAP